MQGAGCRLQGAGCRVQGEGCRVWGVRSVRESKIHSCRVVQEKGFMNQGCRV